MNKENANDAGKNITLRQTGIYIAAEGVSRTNLWRMQE